MRLTDVRLLVDRFDECVRFYTDVMGLQLRLRVPGDVYAELEAGSQGQRLVVGLYRRRLMTEVIGAEYVPASPRTDHVLIGFAVEDVDVAHSRLREQGAEIVTDPHDQEAWGLRVAHLRDPDGNLIEIYRPIG